MVVTWVKDAIKLGWDPFDPGGGGSGTVSSVLGIGPDGLGNVSFTLDDVPDGSVFARPTVDEVGALVGTVGTPSAANPYVTNADARLTNPRIPLAHAASHAAGGSDELTHNALAGRATADAHPATAVSYPATAPYPGTVAHVAAALDWIGGNMGTALAKSKVVLARLPVEAPDGVRTQFTIPFSHVVEDGLMVFLNGQALDPGTYALDITKTQFTITAANKIPKAKDSFFISYTRVTP